MSDGHRMITVTLTEAQHDVFHLAMHRALEEWDVVNHPLKSSRHTLSRAMESIDKAWSEGIRG